jgi:predicted RNA polymerase sigma factor
VKSKLRLGTIRRDSGATAWHRVRAFSECVRHPRTICVQGLELLRTLDNDSRLAGHYRLDLVRAHLLEMVGDCESAIKHYRIAAGRTMSIPEQNYLMIQAARLAERKPS